MKPALTIMFLLALAATVHAQPGPRREAGPPPALPEQRRAELRSALKPVPSQPVPGVEALLDPAAPRRRLTEEERADLRQQLRRQAGDGASPDSAGQRTSTLCNREPTKKTNRSSDDKCY